MNQRETRPKQVAIPRHDTELRVGKERFFFREGRRYNVLERDEFFTKLATRKREVMVTTETVDKLFMLLNLD